MSIVKKSITATLLEAMELSKEYAEKIEAAKTTAKSSLYYKKLKKNNKIVANLLLALDKVDNK